MNGLGDAFDTLTRKKLSDAAVEEYMSVIWLLILKWNMVL